MIFVEESDMLKLTLQSVIEGGLSKDSTPEQLEEALRILQQSHGNQFDKALSTYQFLPSGMITALKNKLENSGGSTVTKRDVTDLSSKGEKEITGKQHMNLANFLEQSLEAEIQELKDQLEKKEKQLAIMKATKTKAFKLLEEMDVEDLDETILLQTIRAKKKQKQEERKNSENQELL